MVAFTSIVHSAHGETKLIDDQEYDVVLSNPTEAKHFFDIAFKKAIKDNIAGLRCVSGHAIDGGYNGIGSWSYFKDSSGRRIISVIRRDWLSCPNPACDENSIRYRNSFCLAAAVGHPAMRRCCKECGLFETDDNRFAVCAKCRLTAYCSKGCQRIHWPWHKATCVAPE
jgi:hypothetical protein